MWFWFWFWIQNLFQLSVSIKALIKLFDSGGLFQWVLEKGKCHQDFKLNSFADFSNKANVFYIHTLISKNPECQPFFSIDLNNKRWKNNKYLVKFDHLIQLCL